MAVGAHQKGDDGVFCFHAQIKWGPLAIQFGGHTRVYKFNYVFQEVPPSGSLFDAFVKHDLS